MVTRGTEVFLWPISSSIHSLEVMVLLKLQNKTGSNTNGNKRKTSTHEIQTNPTQTFFLPFQTSPAGFIFSTLLCSPPSLCPSSPYNKFFPYIAQNQTPTAQQLSHPWFILYHSSCPQTVERSVKSRLLDLQVYGISTTTIRVSTLSMFR